MKNSIKALLTACLLAPLALAGGSAQARNYDCSKAGNANKSVCKGAAAAKPVAPAKGLPVPSSAAKSRATPAMPKAAVARHYGLWFQQLDGIS